MAQLDWTTTLNTMREALPRAQYLSWMEPLEFIGNDETCVRLGVPSRFHEEMVRLHLQDTLRTVIQKQTGAPVQLEFEVLVQKQNIEAASSVEATEKVATPQPTVVQRPSLKLIEGNKSIPREENPFEQEETPVFRPSFPKYTTPYLPFAFNQVPHQACKIFIEGTDATINSLAIIGGTGMGKTHLLVATGETLCNGNPALKVRYTNAESFTAEMIDCFKRNLIHDFKRKYREETDVLLFDNVHELSGRERTQEQVLHIFNELLTAGKRILFTSNIPLHQLQKCIEPLKSRLLSMMSVELQTPSFEDRVAVLAKISEQNRTLIDGQILRTLADRGQRDIRELIGSLLRLHLQAKLENRVIDADFLARQGCVIESQRSQVTLEEIVSLIELNFGVSRTDLMAKNRKSNIAWARQVAMYLARHVTYLALEEIGKFFGRDHATVLYSYEKVVEGVKTQRDVQLQIEYLLERLKNRSPRKS